GRQRPRGPRRARGGLVCGLGRHRRSRLGDALNGLVTAQLQHELVEAQVAVLQRDRLHPGLAAARWVGNALRAADVGQVAVVPLDVTGLDLLLGRAHALLDVLPDVRVDELLPEDGRLQVVLDVELDVAALRPEVRGALRLDRAVAVGHRAQFVLGDSVAVPEAEVRRVGGGYVRDPAGGVADLGGQLA